MAKEADARQASPATVVAVESLVWVYSWCCFANFPPEPFVPQGGPAVALKRGDSLMDGTAPGLADSSKSGPLVVVYVAVAKRLLQTVLVPLLRCPSVTMASGEFAVQGYLGQAMLLHSGDMPCPAKL